MLIFALLGEIAAVSLTYCGLIIRHRATGRGPNQIRTFPAKVVGLETGTTSDSWPPRKVAGTCHATFELSWEGRLKFAVAVEEYERLAVADSGELRYRGSRFVEFKPLQ